MPGTLILCAGPIGNLGDAPPRLADALASADIVYAEDTRRAQTLLGHLGVRAATRSFFAGNEAERAAEIGSRLASGETVAVLTDAGTPGVSDPGMRAVEAAIGVGATVTGIPGPSAVTLAVAVSGLVVDRFVFEGFLPRKGGDRVARLASIAGEIRPVVLFASPNRLGDDLVGLAAAHHGARDCVVCREMTKVYEEIWRGTLEEAAAHWSGRDVKGEVTVVLGPQATRAPSLDDAAAAAKALIEEGAPPSQAVKSVAKASGVSRRELYGRVISDETEDG